MRGQVVFLGLAASLHSAVAQSTSLYLPDFDPQPLSVDELGVGSDGKTTYAVQAISTTDSQGDSDFFPGTFTVAEDSTAAGWTYEESGMTMSVDCAISNGLAACSGGGGDDGPETFTETVSSFLVAFGTATAASASATSPSQSSGSSSGSTSGSGTSSAAVASKTASSSNSSTKQAAISAVSLLGFVSILALLV